MPSRLKIIIGLLLVGLLASVRIVYSQDQLAAARDLYASAAYDEALGLLDSLKASGTAPESSRGVDQYRALCLLALGKTSDAERAIEEVVTTDPTYQPADASPRVRAAFTEVRRRMLPTLVHQSYTAAKAAFDHKEFEDAAAGFKLTLELIDDPTLDPRADPSVSDLRTLANGFLELSVAAIAPPPPPPAPAESQAPPPPSAEPGLTPIYSAGDPGITPPVVLRQDFPQWPSKAGALAANGGHGVLEVIVDDTGSVEQITVRQSVSRLYDGLLVAASRNWKYQPATLNGQPVRFKKTIQVNVNQR